MADIRLPWGDEGLDVHLPENWRLDQEALPSLRPAGADWKERLALSLNQPSSGPALGRLLTARQGGRVAIIVEDLTRHSPLREILQILLRELHHARFRDHQIDLIFATGMHPPMTADQARQKIGDLCDVVPWRSNPWRQSDEYAFVGRVGGIPIGIDRRVLQADLRLVVSSVSPHVQAGFGGGYKMFFPGCAALETIRGLHRLGIGRRGRQLVGTTAERNPMRAAIDAAGALVDASHGRTFAVQYILDGRNLPGHLGTGEPYNTQRMLSKQCSVACGVVVSEPADVVLTSAWPRDHDLWQSFKGVANTIWAARRNGVVICFTHCPAGRDDMKVPNWPVSPAWTRRGVRRLGPETLSSLLTRLVPSLSSDAAFFVRMSLQMLHRNPILMVSPTLAQEGSFPGLGIFATAEEAFAEASQILGPGRQRVIAFPQGGITFPIPTPPTRPARA